MVISWIRLHDQVALEKTKKLTKFTDVVTCWNLTSFVFKNVFSTHVIGEKGEWCDYPLFPEIFPQGRLPRHLYHQ